MNRSALRQRVKELLNMPVTDAATDTGRPSNAVINQAIKEARLALYNELKATMPRRFGASTTVTYTATSESVALPSGAQGVPIFKVEAANSGETTKRTLEPAVLEEFVSLAQDGDPRVYAIVKTSIHLRPRPAVDMTVTLWHTPAAADLGDNTEPTELHADFHHVIGYGAAVRIARAFGDPHEGLLEQYQEDLAVCIRHYEAMTPDHHIHETEQTELYHGY